VGEKMKKMLLALAIVLFANSIPFSLKAAEKSDEQKIAEDLSKLHQLLFGQTIEVSTGHSMVEENGWKKLNIAIRFHLESVQKQVREKLPTCKTVVVNTQFTLNASDSPDAVYLTSLVACLDNTPSP